MKLICISCSNHLYFEVEVETFKAIEAEGTNGLIIDDAIFDDWNSSDETLRSNLNDIVDYVLKEPNETFDCNNKNKYMICARCGSHSVVVPYVEWNPPPDPVSIDEEIINNRDEYQYLRKERSYANNLPILWQS